MKAITMTWVDTPLGPLVAGVTEKGLCLLEFTDRRSLEAQLKSLHKYFGCAMVPGRDSLLESLKQELGEYFSGKRKNFSIPLDVPGTEFQQKVWKELCSIPYGKTRSYEEMAIRLKNPKAKRAVGRANGTNRIGIVIPCHRVVNKDGKLGGYGGGLWRKQMLLDLERNHLRG